MTDRQYLIDPPSKELKEFLREKDVFIFDWDGTILDSMEQKSRNFGQAFCLIQAGMQEHGLANRVAEYYLQFSGYPRKHIFHQIMAILGMDAQADAFLRFNEVFEKLNKGSLIHARIFPDALDLLEELIRRDYRIFISSSVPPQELTGLVEAILPMSLKAGITSILGNSDGHTKGKGHLQTIMEDASVLQDKLLVFGDDIADHELSTEAGVDCILVDRSGISRGQGIKMVSSLIQIKNGLPT